MPPIVALGVGICMSVCFEYHTQIIVYRIRLALSVSQTSHSPHVFCQHVFSLHYRSQDTSGALPLTALKIAPYHRTHSACD